jgi:hypothetical protein
MIFRDLLDRRRDIGSLGANTPRAGTCLTASSASA